jgi:hypothetical protein
MLLTLKLTNNSLNVIRERISKQTVCLDQSSDLAYRLKFGFDNDDEYLMVDMNNLPRKYRKIRGN